MERNVPNPRSSELPRPFPPRRIWLLGAGRFGFIAGERLSRRYPEAELLVVDSRQEKLAQIQNALKLPVFEEDAVAFLNGADFPDDIWIVPAVPVHVAFRWILAQLNKAGTANPLSVPESVDAQVPNPYRVASGTLYASFATFLCPDACSEPEERCTHTKEPRLGNLFEHLEGIQAPGYGVVVLRSWQLAPGVGGYTTECCLRTLEKMKQSPGAYLVATSCRCHGVIDAMRWQTTL